VTAIGSPVSLLFRQTRRAVTAIPLRYPAKRSARKAWPATPYAQPKRAL